MTLRQVQASTVGIQGAARAKQTSGKAVVLKVCGQRASIRSGAVVAMPPSFRRYTCLALSGHLTSATSLPDATDQVATLSCPALSGHVLPVFPCGSPVLSGPDGRCLTPSRTHVLPVQVLAHHGVAVRLRNADLRSSEAMPQVRAREAGKCQQRQYHRTLRVRPGLIINVLGIPHSALRV